MTSLRSKHYPGMVGSLNRYARVGGNQGGILPGMLVSVAATRGEPYLRSATASMPKYHRFALDDPHFEMQYHLAGYGSTNEEAITRLTGEAVERYAAIMSMKLYEDRIVYATYADLSSRSECLPLEYLGIFEKTQQETLANMMPRYSSLTPTDTDVIAWLPCQSLTRPGQDIYVPAQLMFLAFKVSTLYNDKLYTPSFSTGTAAHVSLDAALLNAMVEAVQIDAFILNWYSDHKAPRLEQCERSTSLMSAAGIRENGPYESLPTYLTLPELPIPNIGMTLIRKDAKIPYVAFGLQADIDPETALMRGAAEAVAILGIGTFGTIYDLPRMHFANSSSAFADLDTNVFYFANPKDASLKRSFIESRTSSSSLHLDQIEPYADSTPSAIRRLISDIAKITEWATYLDITPPELTDTPWKVIRVLIPELLSMCLPGFPPMAHPRLKQYGGVTNVAPHPLP